MHPALTLAATLFAVVLGTVLAMVAVGTTVRYRSMSHRYHAPSAADRGDE